MPLGISTSWNAFRHSRGEDIVTELAALGFNAIELSFNLPAETVDEIAALVRRGSVSVVSVHNFCPIPQGLERKIALPDYFSMASRNEEERLRSVRETKRSIDTANRLHAKAVVLHTGRVEIQDATADLIRLYSQGQKEAAEFKRLKEDYVKQRAAVKKRHFDQVLKSLDELNSYAAAQGVLLGVETRFYYREIPTYEELQPLFARFDNSNIFYWHDTGHAQVMEHLGFAQHKDFLASYGDKMLGVHLHDVSGCRDHKPPSSGTIDFSILKPYLSKETLKVIEAHHPATGPEIKKSKEYLEKILDGEE